VCFDKLDRLDLAAKDYEKALEINPKSVEARSGLASVQERLNSTQQALENYNMYYP